MEIRDLIRQFWMEKYQQYSLGFIEDIILSVFKFIKDEISSNRMYDIRLINLGTFMRRDWKVLNYAKVHIIKYEKGRINENMFYEAIKPVYELLIREKEFYENLYVNLYPMVIKYIEEFLNYKENGKDIPDRGWFFEANRRYYVNRAFQRNMGKRQNKDKE